MNMFNCNNKALPNEPAKIGNKKPIVLSTQRYDKLLNNATNSDKLRIQKEAEEEQKYREYLMNGSEDLVAHFRGNIPRTQDQKIQEMKEELDKKTKRAEQIVKQSKENDEKLRREKVAKAQQLIEKLKPGPRELHSAVIQSEVLRVRNVQRNINEEFEKAIRKQECFEKKACEQQAMPFIQEEQERMAERQKRANNYKQELLQTINDNTKNRTDFKKQLIKEQQAAREAMDQEIKAQIEKEKAIMEKKRAALRKNALEAMKMVEQRRLRERMMDEVEDRLCCVYNSGKQQLDTMKNDHIKQVAADREKATEVNAQHLVSIQSNTQVVEAERLRRDISRMQLKFTAEEQEKIRKDKAAKQARIEAYIRDLQQQKEAKQRMEEEKRFDMAQRFKNTEVNCLFNEAQKEENTRKVQEFRAQLKQQADEKKRVETAERDVALECQEAKHLKENKFFFEYARNLMEDAQKKDRPLYPFVKVVQQYKRDHQMECDRKTPKHLVSHLSLGCRQPGDSKADAEHAAKQTEDSKEKIKKEKTDKEQILENCLKINELIAADTKVEKNNCTQVCPFDCQQHGKLANKGQGDGPDECISQTSSAKLRYSMNELRQMNQFATSPAMP